MLALGHVLANGAAGSVLHGDAIALGPLPQRHVFFVRQPKRHCHNAPWYRNDTGSSTRVHCPLPAVTGQVNPHTRPPPLHVAARLGDIAPSPARWSGTGSALGLLLIKALRSATQDWSRALRASPRQSPRLRSRHRTRGPRSAPVGASERSSWHPRTSTPAHRGGRATATLLLLRRLVRAGHQRSVTLRSGDEPGARRRDRHAAAETSRPLRGHGCSRAVVDRPAPTTPSRPRGGYRAAARAPPRSSCQRISRLVDDGVNIIDRFGVGQPDEQVDRVPIVCRAQCREQALADQSSLRDIASAGLAFGTPVEVLVDIDVDPAHALSIHMCGLMMCITPRPPRSLPTPQSYERFVKDPCVVRTGRAIVGVTKGSPRFLSYHLARRKVRPAARVRRPPLGSKRLRSPPRPPALPIPSLRSRPPLRLGPAACQPRR